MQITTDDWSVQSMDKTFESASGTENHILDGVYCL